MTWCLAEDEIGELMQAAATVLDPWMCDRPTQVTWRNEDGTTEPMHLTVRGINPEAPEPIKRLDRIYMAIIEKGAFAVDPDEIARHEDAPLPSCDCGTPGKGQHFAATCTRREDNHA